MRKCARNLSDRGHLVEARPPWCEGHVLGIRFDPQRRLLEGGADPRGQMAVVMPAQTIGWADVPNRLDRRVPRLLCQSPWNCTKEEITDTALGSNSTFFSSNAVALNSL